MRQRKRRKTMRSEFAQADSLMRTNAMTRILCVNGVCAARPCSLPTPSIFNSGDCAPQLKCTSDGLSAEYEVSGREDKDAAAIRADVPIPQHGIAIYYFEVTVVSAGTSGRIGVGLCQKNVKLDKMPGWELGSYGYHGDDGCTFQENSHNGETYGPKYGGDDVIGCCWDLVDDTVFFTKNGQPLATAFRGVKGTFYPTVGMQTKGGRVKVNFGESTFLFDIDSYVQGQRERVIGNILSVPLPEQEDLLAETVLGYLVHSGYAEAAEAFARETGYVVGPASDTGTGSVVSNGPNAHANRISFGAEKSENLNGMRIADTSSFHGIHERRGLMAKIVEGRAEEALTLALKQFPELRISEPETDFLLQSQLFIEMLMSGEASIDAALEFGRSKLLPFYETFPSQLEEVFCLLAYKDPSSSPVAHLVAQERRQIVADKLNEAILESQERPRRSTLDRNLGQCKTVLEAHADCANGPLALLRVDDFL